MWVQKSQLTKEITWKEVLDWVVINGVLWVEIPEAEGGQFEMLTEHGLRQFSGTEHLCCAQHKCSYVALLVMWPNALSAFTNQDFLRFYAT